jgi:hypothetical protein
MWKLDDLENILQIRKEFRKAAILRERGLFFLSCFWGKKVNELQEKGRKDSQDQYCAVGPPGPG